jgi:hypothetical protein
VEAHIKAVTERNNICVSLSYHTTGREILHVCQVSDCPGSVRFSQSLFPSSIFTRFHLDLFCRFLFDSVDIYIPVPATLASRRAFRSCFLSFCVCFSAFWGCFAGRDQDAGAGRSLLRRHRLPDPTGP